MKYFIVELSGIDNPNLDDAAKAELKDKHLAYFGEASKAGLILFNGPKVGAVGGCIVFKAESYEKAQDFFSNDPHVLGKLREYKIIEFTPAGCQDFVKAWFD